MDEYSIIVPSGKLNFIHIRLQKSKEPNKLQVNTLTEDYPYLDNDQFKDIIYDRIISIKFICRNDITNNG